MKSKANKMKVADWIFVFLCVLISIICLLPMLNLLARSLSSTEALIKREVYLWPKGWNLESYKMVLTDMKYIWSFWWTVILTFVCTIFSLTMTTLCAYPLIFENLKGRNVINILITITMFFNAGAIPNYLLLQKLNLLDNPLVLIIPTFARLFTSHSIRLTAQAISPSYGRYIFRYPSRYLLPWHCSMR